MEKLSNNFESTNSKIDKLRKLMSEKGIDVYIVPTSDPHGFGYVDEAYKTIKYLCGFTGSDSTLIVTLNEAALFVDGRYHIQADIETENTCINVYKVGCKDVLNYIEYLKKHVKEGDTVAFDGKVVMRKNFEEFSKNINAAFEYEIDLISEIKRENIEPDAKEIIILSDEITGENSDKKLAKLREKLKQKGADAVFFSSLDDICYLFNIRGRDIIYSTVAFSYAYITEESATLYLKKNAINEKTVNHFAKIGVNVADYDEILKELFKLKGKKILVDKQYTSCYFYKALGVGNELLEVNNYELVTKYIKNETEQNLFRKYAVYDAVAMIEYIVHIKDLIANGYEIDETDAADILKLFRSKMPDFYSLSFGSICAYAENAAIVHYSPKKETAKKLSNKGFLLVDSGSHYMGATTDITRTIALGELSEEERVAYTVVLKGNLTLMGAVFLKGTRCENLDILARESLWKLGLDYRHGTGHGIGSFLSVHEGPIRIATKIRDDNKQPELTPGMVLSDEPGYYADSCYGIRHETELLCVKKFDTEYGEYYGFEPLSLVPFEKDVICFELFTHEEFDILKRYYNLIREKVMPHLSENGKKWLDYNTNFVD